MYLLYGFLPEQISFTWRRDFSDNGFHDEELFEFFPGDHVNLVFAVKAYFWLEILLLLLKFVWYFLLDFCFVWVEVLALTLRATYFILFYSIFYFLN